MAQRGSAKRSMKPSWDFARADSCSAAVGVVPRVVVGETGRESEMLRWVTNSSCAETSFWSTNVQSVEISNGRAYTISIQHSLYQQDDILHGILGGVREF